MITQLYLTTKQTMKAKVMNNTLEKNKNEKGYKKTKLGWIPQEWGIVKLADIANIFVSNVDKNCFETEIPVKLCNYTDVYKNDYITSNLDFMQATASRSEIEKFILVKGDVLVTKDSEDCNDIAVPAFVKESLKNVLCGYHLAIFRPQEELLSGEYLAKILKIQKLRNYFAVHANGVTRFGLNCGVINNTPIPLPPLLEQQKIAEVLTSWDNAIEKTEKLIEFRQKTKNALMQSLLTGKLRFPQFAGHEWKTVKLKDIFEKVNRKNSENNHNILTISAQHGLVSQAEFYNKRIASVDTSKYILLKNGEFAYNKSYSKGYPMGAIKRLDKYDYGVVSSLYICFSSKVDNICSDFFSHFFEAGLLNNEIQIVAQEGARNHGLLNISSTDFFNIEFKIPSNKEEQQKIVAVLNSCDREIEILKQKLNKLNEQKKGLMQKLLTGQVRVKLNKEAV